MHTGEDVAVGRRTPGCSSRCPALRDARRRPRRRRDARPAVASRRRVRARGPAPLEAPQQGRRRRPGHLPQPRLMVVTLLRSAPPAPPLRWAGRAAALRFAALPGPVCPRFSSPRVDAPLPAQCGSTSVPLLALGRHAGRLRPRRRRRAREMTDDLLYHGDLNAALRRMHAAGLPGPQRRAAAGPARDARAAAAAPPGRARERTTSAASTTTSPSELREVVDRSATGSTSWPHEARRVGRPAPPGAHRAGRRSERQTAARPAAARPRRPGARRSSSTSSLDRGPRAVRGADGPAPRAADAELLQPDVGGMQNMTPERHAAHEGHARRAQPDARAARARARSPTSTGSWSATATSSPGTRRPSTSCSSRWRSAWPPMQPMLNSMTPEQRAQLQALAEQLLEDMDLRWQVDQLGQNLQQPFPQTGVGPALRLLAARTRCGFGRGRRRCIDAARRPRRAREPAARRHQPGALAEVDIDQARELLGDDAAAQPRAAGRAGQDARGGRPDREQRRAASS